MSAREEEDSDPDDEAPVSDAELRARLIEALHDELETEATASPRWILIAAAVIVFGALAVMGVYVARIIGAG